MIESSFGQILEPPSDPDLQPATPPQRTPAQLAEYYFELESEARAFLLPDEVPWFDMWHTHPDWEGDGNRSAQDRERHLKVGRVIFERVLEQAAKRTVLIQVWYVIDPHDSAQDSVYAHTRNPNHDNFPYTFVGVRWDAEVPPLIRSVFAGSEYDIGRSDDRWTLYWVRPTAAA